MSFQDLEKYIRCFFQKAVSQRASHTVRERIFEKTMEKFLEQKESHRTTFWKKILVPRTSIMAFAAVSMVVLFNLLPGSQSFLSAGKLLPKYGPVEILRGDNVILVEKATHLRQGDVIRVGNKAEAEIIFPNHLSSTAKSRSQLRVVDRNSLFLEKGALQNKTFNAQSEVSTSRGFVKSFPGASFSVAVSESGETEVISEKSDISVFDWKEGQTLLSPGDVLKLRTDTTLSDSKIPQDISLSLSQIQAIQAKMIIARTKALTAIENALQGNKKESGADITSAKKSFLSIVQVLDSSRNLEITKRKQLDTLTLSDVPIALSGKTMDSSLIKEAESIQALLSLSESNLSQLGFAFPPSSVQSFNRFVLLDRIFSFGTSSQRDLGKILKEKYVVAFLRDILNEEVMIDQVSKLNQEISNLPKSPLAKEFLVSLRDHFAPDIAALLEVKIENAF
ncbi:hypothetical protein K9L27_00355 [Candidatus Gracilibacteria bacterium]|nr:hypothetical protein [Candidatus Gracilibacteria bacterium]